MKHIRLTIDGHPIDVTRESTVLEAIQQAGIYVPTLCHDPHLKPFGACRLCIVQIDGLRGLPTACTTPAKDGMRVVTSTEEIEKIRRSIVEMAIANHPEDCLTCHKSEQCELLRVARYLEVQKESVARLRRTDRHWPIDTSNAAFDFDPNKCILCGKCVRVCNEIQGLGAIDFAGRGYHTRISTFAGQPRGESICQTCGECVERCPTGALVPKKSVTAQREVKTLCPFCGVGCTLYLGVRGDTLVRARGDLDSPVNQGGLCVKGRFGFDFVNHSDRLTRPLIRKKGIPRTISADDVADISEVFREAEWEEALELTASRLKKIRAKAGPDALGVLSSAKCTNEENYMLQKFARAAIGTNNVDHCARLCHSSTVVAALAAFGDGAMSNSIDDIAQAGAMLVIGSNTTECHPIIGRRIKQNVRLNGAKLIVADPRTTELVNDAFLHLNHRPGTDVALLNGIMHQIVANNWHDKAFITKRCENFDTFSASLDPYTPEYVEAISGVPAPAISRCAEVLGRATSVSVIYGMGITQHTTGTDNVKSIANLLMLTGNMGGKGMGFSPLRGQNNVQGACDMGALPNVYPGYQKVVDPEIQTKFSQAWRVDLDNHIGLALTDMVQAADQGHLLGMYILGENPLMSEPNLEHARQAFNNLEFLAVQDIFLTETGFKADVILPAASFAEKDGTFTNTERRVQLVRQVLAPPGDARQDWQIISDIAFRMGYSMSYSTSKDIMAEIARLAPIYGGISHARLKRRAGGLQWPCWNNKHPGTARLHKHRFTRGRGRFHVVEYHPPAELPSESFPIVLTTGRILEHFHTGSMSRRSQVLETLEPESHVDLCPEDAVAMGVSEGETVLVKSPRGEIMTKIHKDQRVQSGMAFMAFHWKEAPANVLTNSTTDPISKIPEFKVSSVKAERITAEKPGKLKG